ncbi:espin-like [Bolinopsis microptera]|uniref:espin-like n=1 Tax=Bolinopsis microptera TaxID=2820187 RepID=UPI00307A6398
MSQSGPQVKKKDLQKISSVIQEFQAKILQDVDAAKLRDALNLTLLQMQTFWKILKKKQDRGKPDKFTWQWYDLRNPEYNRPQYLANSLYGAGVQKEKLTELFELLSVGDGERCQKYIESKNYNGEVDSLGRGPLHYCAGVADLEHYVKFFANNGCDVNHQAHDGSTALHRAVINENPIVTDDLLNLKADASLRDIEGRTPAHWAVHAQDSACLQLFVKYNVETNIADNECDTPIMWAAKLGNATALKILLSSPIGPKLALTTDSKGQSLLQIGVKHIDVVKLLLNSETVNQNDKFERNILHHAALQGTLEVCKIIDEQFDLKSLITPDCEGKTPVHHAVNNAHSGVTNYLLEHGGSTTSPDNQGLTPHSIAQIKQLHYCSIVISAYHQNGELEQKHFSNPRPQTPKMGGNVKSSSVAAITNKRQSNVSFKPSASLNHHPADRRVIIHNNSSSLSKSSPAARLRIQPPANLSTITPGLLRHKDKELEQVSQKPSRLRELTDIRDKITGRAEQPAVFPQRPASSRGKRNKRPSSPVPVEPPQQEGPPIPWKLNIIPPRPPPPREEEKSLTNGHSHHERDGVEEKEMPPERPGTARGSNIDQLPSNDSLSREDSGVMQLSSTNLAGYDDQLDMKISPRYSKIENIPLKKGDQVVIEQTLELIHSVPDGNSLRGNPLLGPMPSLPGRQLPPDPNPWYKKKLNPVAPNRMDILQPENPNKIQDDK